MNLAVPWYLRYSLSDHDLKEILAERRISVDHSDRLVARVIRIAGYEAMHMLQKGQIRNVYLLLTQAV
jgi:transposase-like protein